MAIRQEELITKEDFKEAINGLRWVIELMIAPVYVLLVATLTVVLLSN